MSFANFKRKLRQYKLKRRGERLVETVDVELMRNIINDYLAQGWEKDRLSEFIDVSEQFDEMTLRKGMSHLLFRMKKDDNGEIIGSENAINGLASSYQLTSTQEPKL